jgi:hypothetical protein
MRRLVGAVRAPAWFKLAHPAGINQCWIALKSRMSDMTKAKAYFERALAVARQQQAKILGTPRRNEPRTPLAFSGRAVAS